MRRGRARDVIFDRFSRGSEGGNRASDSGVGLGLALVDEHVRLHGGRVWVEDRRDGAVRRPVRGRAAGRSLLRRRRRLSDRRTRRLDGAVVPAAVLAAWRSVPCGLAWRSRSDGRPRADPRARPCRPLDRRARRHRQHLDQPPPDPTATRAGRSTSWATPSRSIDGPRDRRATSATSAESPATGASRRSSPSDARGASRRRQQLDQRHPADVAGARRRRRRTTCSTSTSATGRHVEGDRPAPGRGPDRVHRHGPRRASTRCASRSTASRPVPLDDHERRSPRTGPVDPQATTRAARSSADGAASARAAGRPASRRCTFPVPVWGRSSTANTSFGHL